MPSLSETGSQNKPNRFGPSEYSVFRCAHRSYLYAAASTGA